MIAFIRILIAVLIVGVLASGALWLFAGRRTYRDATRVMATVLALAVISMVAWGIYERRSGYAVEDPALMHDAEQTLNSVQPSNFDLVSDCLRELDVLTEFYARHPDRYAQALEAARRSRDEAQKALDGRKPQDVLCAELPQLEALLQSGKEDLRAAARTR